MPGRRKDHVTVDRLRHGVGVPGAGVYDPRDSYSKKNGPLFSVSKSKRDHDIKLYKNTPGAGTYEPDCATKVVRASSASWSMGGEKRPKQQHFVPPTPGPGKYGNKSLTGAEGPNYSINPRPKESAIQTPGPGAYQPIVPTVQTTAP